MRTAKKKLLVMVDWFYPGYKAGGPIQSCVNFCIAFNQHYDIYVLTSDTDHGETLPYQAIQADQWMQVPEFGVQVFYASKQGRSFGALKQVMQAVNADYIYLNHLYSPRYVIWPFLLKVFGAVEAKLVICPRGALYDSAISVKRYKKVPLLWVYRRLQIANKVVFHATNQREAAAIQQHFPGATCLIADNLPNLKQDELQIIPKEKGHLKIVYIARIVAIKNLQFLLQCLMKIDGQVALTIAGPAEDAAYWQQCLQIISSLKSNIQVTVTGAVEHRQIPALIKQHHVFMLPTTGENFGHAIFEALLAGRPVLISDQTPWLNMASHQAGWDIALQSPEVFENTLQQLVNMNQAEWQDWANGAWRFAANYLQQHAATAQYLRIFQ